MKKKALLLFTILLVLSLALSACESGADKDSAKMNDKLQQATADEIGDYLLKTVKFEDTLTKVGQDLMKKFYLVEAKDFDEATLYVPIYSAEEIAVVKIKNNDSKELEKLTKIFEERLEIQRAAFNVYRPEEIKKIDEAVIYSEGNTVIFVVSNDKKAVEEAIKNFGKDEE